MRKKLNVFWPFLFLFIFWFVFASPYFIKGKLPYASDYQVNFFPPWSHYQKFAGPVKNNAMPDVHGQIYPWKKFTIDTYKQGQIPLWNPYNFSGNPHLANYQSAVFSPFNIVFFIVPFLDAWSIVVLLQPFLAGIFCYLFVRALEVSKIGSLVSAVSFMFCGFIVVWMAYGTLSMAISFLPLALFAIEKYCTGFKKRYLLLLSFSLVLSFYSGHFQTSIYLLLTVVLYSFYRSFQIKKPYGILYVFFAIFFGLLLSSPQILPSIQFYNNAVRSEIFISGGGVPFYYLPTIFAPDFFGNPVTRNDWFGFYAEWSSFIGIIPFTLMCIAIIGKKKKTTLFFVIFSFFVLLLVVDSPLQKILGMLKLPVISTSNPNRIIVLLSFSFAVLAGVGLDVLKDLLEKRLVKKLAIPFVAVGIVLLFLWMVLLSGMVLSREHFIIARNNFVLSTVLFVGFTCLTIASFFTKKIVFYILCFILFATSFNSYYFVQKWMPVGNRLFVYPDVSVIQAIKEKIGDGRIFGNLGAEVTTYYNFPGIEGYDPLYIGRYGEFIRSADTGEFQKGERSVVKIARNGKYTNRALDLLGVSIIFNPIPDTNQGWAYPVWEDEKRNILIYKDDRFELYRNKEALPRATLFYKTESLTDDKKLLKRFYTEDFDFRNTLLLEDVSPVVLHAGTGSAQIIKYTPNSVTISVNTTDEAFLFLSDNYYPGWVVRVNGRQGKIYRADYSFRAVIVPKGKSFVEFTYEGWYI